MLSYRHSYHAGNFADVLKHSVLSLCIEALKEKEKPFIYLDTHAGAGRYLLQSKQANKTAEYLSGISPIWTADDIPSELDAYLSVLKYYNRTELLKYYPGSPLIAKQLLRMQDKLFLSEIHPTDHPLLKQEFLKDKRAKVVREDGYLQLKSKLPPTSRRGIILIDPSYEMKDDYKIIPKAILQGYKRFSTGTYLLWYPVVNRRQTQQMIDEITESGIKKVLQIELGTSPDNIHKGMTATGMIVINPPWKLNAQMTKVLPWIYEKVSQNAQGHFFVKELVGE